MPSIVSFAWVVISKPQCRVYILTHSHLSMVSSASKGAFENVYRFFFLLSLWYVFECIEVGDVTYVRLIEDEDASNPPVMHRAAPQ